MQPHLPQNKSQPTIEEFMEDCPLDFMKKPSEYGFTRFLPEDDKFGFIYVNEKSEILDKYTCAICKDVLEDPVMDPRCGILFCRNCLQEWLSSHHDCPICRCPISSPISAPKIITNELLEMEVECNQCKKVIKSSACENHTLKECQHSCPNGCGVKVTRDQFDIHTPICCNLECPYLCGFTGSIAPHLKNCPYKSLMNKPMSEIFKLAIIGQKRSSEEFQQSKRPKKEPRQK